MVPFPSLVFAQAWLTALFASAGVEYPTIRIVPPEPPAASAAVLPAGTLEQPARPMKGRAPAAVVSSRRRLSVLVFMVMSDPYV